MKMNKYEARLARAAKMDKALKGGGLYVYENITNGDLMLPKATASGQNKVAAGASFQGDDYFQCLVKDHQCRLVKTIYSPQHEKEMNVQQEARDQKLLTDQPDVVTEAGKVEFVADTNSLLTEQPKVSPVVDAEEKLINEEPLDGIDIILE